LSLGDQSPLFYYQIKRMIPKEEIETIIKEAVRGTDIFIVTVKSSAANKITVLADTLKGITIDECALLHRKIEEKLDRDKEDFELQVSSPGLDSPFIVLEQYLKNNGKTVEVTDEEGTKHRGVIKNITSGGFELLCDIKTKGKGKETIELSFNFDQVRSTRVVFNIK